jgi:hypothetical protein
MIDSFRTFSSGSRRQKSSMSNVSFLKFLREIKVDGTRFYRQRVGADVQDAIHLHPHQCAAVGDTARSCRMVGADRPNRCRTPAGVLQNRDDVVDRVSIDDHAWMRNEVAKPVRDRVVRH